MTTLQDIEKMTHDYAEAMTRLDAEASAIGHMIDEIKRKARPQIMRLVKAAAERKQRLHEAIDESRSLFKKPRTRTFDGVKVGVKKEKGKVVVKDERKTIERLRYLFQAPIARGYIAVKESVVKDALRELPATTLMKLGVSIEDDHDEVYIKDVGTEVEKLINALFEGMEKEVEG